MKTNRFKLLLVLLIITASATVHAQSYSIDWFSVDGGGRTSTGGVYSVSGTIGQPDAGKSTGGNFSIDGGFWSIVAVQTPGLPRLFIQQIGGGVRVYWPTNAIGFILDQSPTVTGTWSQVSFPYTTNATDISITVPSPSGNKFYRLRGP
jgi:hypothetical protein